MQPHISAARAVLLVTHSLCMGLCAHCSLLSFSLCWCSWYYVADLSTNAAAHTNCTTEVYTLLA